MTTPADINKIAYLTRNKYKEIFNIYINDFHI